MKIHFTKMQGLGNDFVVIDGVTQAVKFTTKQIQQLANRYTGIGFDQLLLVEQPKNSNADFFYRVFNADGGEVSQCGNGARCLAKFLQDQELTSKNPILVDTREGQMELKLETDGLVTVNMGIPNFVPEKIPFIAEQQALAYVLQIDEQELEVSALSIGNPHVVLMTSDAKHAPVMELGSRITKHARFPAEVNVGFLQIINRQNVRLRVYERGVGETQACGSGACAAVIAGRSLGLLDETVLVEQPGGQMQVKWRGENAAVYLTGPAVRVFSGVVDLDDV